MTALFYVLILLVPHQISLDENRIAEMKTNLPEAIGYYQAAISAGNNQLKAPENPEYVP